MRRRAALLTTLAGLIAGLGAGEAHAQAPPPSVQQRLGDGLFHEREPEEGEEDLAAGRREPPAAPAALKPEPGTASTAGYDERLRQSFQAAERFQGPLDGGWRLSAAGGGPLFAVRFVDHAGKLEAVWRDLRRPATLNASGVVDEVAREGARLTLRFSPTAGAPEVARLTAAPGEGWTGELDEGGRRLAVTLTKTSP